MEIRVLTEQDAESFYNCMKAIDQETQYMLFEPNERVYNEDLIKEKLRNKNSLMIGVVENGKVLGFLLAERAKYRRNCHSAYIVTGIRKAYRHQGIGTRFFDKLDGWAKANQLVRLELTVAVPNIVAINLYQKNGFVIEGLKKHTLFVNSDYLDEYMMAKIYR